MLKECLTSALETCKAAQDTQWSFLVPVKGGRCHIIPHLAVRIYTTDILPSGGYILPTTVYGNQKQPLRHSREL